MKQPDQKDEAANLSSEKQSGQKDEAADLLPENQLDQKDEEADLLPEKQPDQKDEEANLSSVPSVKKSKLNLTFKTIRILYYLLLLCLFPLGLSAVVIYWCVMLLSTILVLIWFCFDRRRVTELRGMAIDVGIMSVMVGLIFVIYRTWILP
jgi:hypothetical protein